MRLVLITALLVAALSGPAAARELECFAIVGPDPHNVTYQAAPGYTVEHATPPMREPQVEGTVQSIGCMRDALYLSPNDIHVLTILNMPLLIGTATEGDRRLLTFELSGGQFRAKVYDGTFTAEERRQTDMAIESMGSRVLIEQNVHE